MSDSSSDDSESTAAEIYGEGYYASGCGPFAYDRSHPHWGTFFGNIADDLVRTFRPQRVFDAGCALGFLVEALWDRGVVAYGRDISKYAITNTRTDIRPFCSVGSLTDPIEGRFDLVVCIEVLEHMTEQDGMRAIANMTAAADRVVFSSSPDDLTETTHINVKPAIYWMRAFAEQGFAPLIDTTVFSITPYALLFERSEAKPSGAFLSACATIVRHRMKCAEHARTVSELSLAIADKDRDIAAKAAAYDQLAAEHAGLRSERESLGLSLFQLASERDELATERDRLQSSYERALADHAALTAERDRLRDDFRQAQTNTAALALSQSQLAAEQDRLEKERLAAIRQSLDDIIETNAQLQSLNDQISRSRLWRLGRKLRRVVNRGRSTVLGVKPPLLTIPGPARGSQTTGSIGIKIGLDSQFYLDQYPDIAQAGLDPLEHYVLYGQHEGRSPSLYAFEKSRRVQPDFVPAEPELMRLHELCDPHHEEVGAKVSDEAFLISVITPTYNVEPRYIRELYQTLFNQSYANWEWVVMDDGSTRTTSIPVLREIAEKDPRLRFTCSPVNLGIAGASNAALASARGSHVALVDHDDLVARGAFLAIYHAWKAAPNTQIFFTDECKLQSDGRLTDFWAKPDWSPAYLECTMFMGHLSVFRYDFIKALGGFRSEFDGTQDFDLALRAMLRAPKVVHIPIFAYLWRMIPGSAAMSSGEKAYAIPRQQRALLDYARHHHPDAVVAPGHSDGFWRVSYPLPKVAPLLSYVIPAGGGVRTVRGKPTNLVVNCIQSFERTGFYKNSEYIVVHNGNLPSDQVEALSANQRVRLLVHKDESFNFSRTVNVGVAAARGEYVCLLNDDIEAITPRGGEEIIGYLSVNSAVGALGPKCLFEDGRIQQCGVVLLGAAGPAHAATGMPRNFGGHHFNLLCRRDVFAVGAATLFMRKALFEEIGGFREEMPLNYNDVDFSLRLRDRGHRCVVDPAVEVYHFESATKVGTAMVEQERMFLDRAEIEDPYFGKWFEPSRPDYHLDMKAPDMLRPFGAWLDRHIARRTTGLDQTSGIRISICLMVNDQPLRILDQACRSATMQTHAEVQLLVLDQGIRDPKIRQWVQALTHRGIQFVEDAELGDMGAFARNVLRRVEGDFVVFLSGSDFISVDAMQILACCVEKDPSAALFYTDHYHADEISTRMRPVFKPDFDPVLLSNSWFPVHLLAAKRALVRQVCELASEESVASIEQQLVVQAVLNGEKPRHIRELAYARRILNESPDDAAPSLGEDTHERVVMRILQAARPERDLAVETQASGGTRLLRLRALAPVSGLTVLEAQSVWGDGGSGIAGLGAAAEAGAEWIALLLTAPPDHDLALRELSAPAMVDRRINAVCGILTEKDVVLWSGGVFIPGGRVFDPQAGQAMEGGGHQGLLSCQRCIDVGASVNVLFRAAAIARAIERFAVTDADSLMVALGLDAHEREEFICVTPYLRAEVSPALVTPPADRRGIALRRPSLADGSRWYDGRLEVERPYTMPGCA